MHARVQVSSFAENQFGSGVAALHYEPASCPRISAHLIILGIFKFVSRLLLHDTINHECHQQRPAPECEQQGVITAAVLKQVGVAVGRDSLA